MTMIEGKHKDLWGHQVAFDTALLERVPNPSRRFQDWVESAMHDYKKVVIPADSETGKPTERIVNSSRVDIAVSAIIQKGLADSALEALSYLNGMLADFKPTTSRIAKQDFDRRGNSEKWRLIREKVGETPKPKTDTTHRQHGTFGHVAIADILANIMTNKESAVQPNLPLVLDGQLSLPGDFGVPKRVIDWDYMTELDQYLGELRTILDQNTDGKLTFTRATLANFVGNRLSEHLRSVYGNEHMDKIRFNGDPGRNHLTVYTLAIWGGAAKFALGSDARILFSELAPWNEKAHTFKGRPVNVGRMDAVELTSLSGQPLSNEQLRRARQIVREHPRNTEELLRHLMGTFNGSLDLSQDLRIIDFKMGFGDGSQKNQVIYANQIAEGPFPDHARQIRDYASNATLAAYEVIRQEGRPVPENWWDLEAFNFASLCYFLHSDDEPVDHCEIVTPDQKREYAERRADRLPVVQRKADIRDTDNFVANYLVGVLENRAVTLPVRALPMQMEGVTAVSEIDRLYESRRVFVDGQRIVEEVGGRNSRFRVMHVDTLIKAINSGDIETGYFGLDRGGMIKCFLPEHGGEDDTPSLYLSIDRGTFKCFGRCSGIPPFRGGGRFAMDSIPENLPEISEQFRSKYFRGERASGTEPDQDHLKFMRDAQEVFTRAFRDSPAQDYLTQVRKIDADLAAAYGVGFATVGSIRQLLEAYDLDSLIRYGLVGYSEYKGRRGSLYGLLKYKGYSDADIVKEHLVKKGIIDNHYPYFILDQTATFPLTLDASRINSFYGRTVNETNKRFAHRKLRLADHGGFNMGVLESGYDELIMVEAPIDGLSFIQMGLENTAALIGVNNEFILRQVAKSGKALAFSLDNDPTGRDVTAHLISHMGHINPSLRTRDFTAALNDAFYEGLWSNPVNWKDANHLLTNYGPDVLSNMRLAA